MSAGRHDNLPVGVINHLISQRERARGWKLFERGEWKRKVAGIRGDGLFASAPRRYVHECIHQPVPGIRTDMVYIPLGHLSGSVLKRIYRYTMLQSTTSRLRAFELFLDGLFTPLRRPERDSSPDDSRSTTRLTSRGPPAGSD